jgi:hypothetical protein
MTTKELIDILRADTAFMALVGTYTADDGVTTDPSIAMLFQNQQLDSRSTDGLEVVVLWGPESDDRPMIYQMQTQERIFEVHLIQHKTTGTYTMESAIQRIHQLFPFNATGSRIKVPEDSFFLDEYVMSIEDSDIDPANATYDWLV